MLRPLFKELPDGTRVHDPWAEIERENVMVDDKVDDLLTAEIESARQSG